MRTASWYQRACGLFLMGAAAAIAAGAQTFTSLHSFDYTDGGNPYAGLTQGTNGSLYGAAYAGGADSAGTVFKITTAGVLTTLHSFCSQGGCLDGYLPHSAPIQATNGNLYGTTDLGGANGVGGTVYEITPSGTLTTLYSFCSQPNCADGAYAYGALVQGTDGNFYGTTNQEGNSNNAGTVFKITPSGTLTTLYTFCSQSDCTDGAYPFAALVQGTDGNFYGTTGGGGAASVGTVFKITPRGVLTTLYSFCSQTNCADGSTPYAPLVQASDGNFYGTTLEGGSDISDAGTVFRITPAGVLTTLYAFCSQAGCTDGSSPTDGLIQATDGNLYGTTYTGGAAGDGTIFRISLTGGLKTLYSFCSTSGCPDGANPWAALVQDTSGKFYGTTYLGGASNAGTVFSLSVGLGPFVETLPTSGKVGKPVKILGTNLTGATSVTFNGTPATFTVSSRTLITATVPTGATTGTVKVTTPSATLSSNVPFRVLP